MPAFHIESKLFELFRVLCEKKPLHHFPAKRFCHFLFDIICQIWITPAALSTELMRMTRMKTTARYLSTKR